ncbi:MAG: 5-formyltetrahydrofolate cyclo-ligase [Clostridia bacterium]|nr:5-formyltetrahydrofolate cyclo-ligase [Clostridia bacterium]
MKDEIRYVQKIKRKYFEGVRREFADEVIYQNFMTVYGAYKSFFIYNSFGTEADTKRIIAGCLEAGKDVYLPKVEGENIFPVPYGEMKKGAFGVEEPCGQAYKGNIDVAVIPLLAVNDRGFRLGYGKGYYDRFLKGRNIIKVGLGYGFQLADFKEDGWDEPLDSFLTEKGIYYFGK